MPYFEAMQMTAENVAFASKSKQEIWNWYRNLVRRKETKMVRQLHYTKTIHRKELLFEP